MLFLEILRHQNKKLQVVNKLLASIGKSPLNFIVHIKVEAEKIKIIAHQINVLSLTGRK